MISGFNVESKEHRKLGIPIEDSFAFDSKKLILAIADGVTRDPAEVLPETKKEFAQNYPKISPAKIVADTFTQGFLRLREYNKLGINAVFRNINSEIRRWNKVHIPKPDYVTNDLAGCVSAGVVVVGNKFHYGFICDCGVAVFDSNGKLKLRTENQGPDKYDKCFWPQIRKKFGKDAGWRMPEIRREIRMNYRNNPKNPYFGVLTGQANAMKYVRVGSGNLSERDAIVVYTDGLEGTIYSNAFSHKIAERDIRGLKRICQENGKKL